MKLIVCKPPCSGAINCGYGLGWAVHIQSKRKPCKMDAKFFFCLEAKQRGLYSFKAKQHFRFETKRKKQNDVKKSVPLFR
jgi:hypothetical protein